MNRDKQSARAIIAAGSLSSILLSAALPAQAASPSGYGATVIHSFGTYPVSVKTPDYSPLTLGADGNFYSAASGGAANTGVLYRMKPSGAVSILHAFSAASGTPLTNTDGIYPDGVLVSGADGNLYGVAQAGGANGAGTLYKISTAGKMTILHTFGAYDPVSWTNADGAGPNGPLLLASDGSIFGTAVRGGTYGGGVVFQLKTDGSLTVLHHFGEPLPTGGNDVAAPHSGVIMASDGNFYGLTAGTDTASNITGSIYRLTPGGQFTLLHTFDNSLGDTNYPEGPLVLGDDGGLYGTTFPGPIFRITLQGDYSLLHNGNDQGPYVGNALDIDGTDALAGLIKGADGYFYGTMANGGEFGFGDVFRLSASGDFTALYYFGGTPADSEGPVGAVAFGPDGNLYGTTLYGGSKNLGAAYRLPMPVPAGWGTGGTISVNATLSPTTISLGKGQTATITWSAPAAAQCHFNGQTLANSGSLSYAPSKRGVYYFRLACDNAGKATTVALPTLTATR